MFAIFNDYIKLHGFRRFIWESFLYFWCNWTCSGKSPTLQSSMQKRTLVMRNKKRWVNVGFLTGTKAPTSISTRFAIIGWLKTVLFFGQIFRWMVPEGSMVKVAALIPMASLITWQLFIRTIDMEKIQDDDEIFFTWFWYSNKSKRWWFSMTKTQKQTSQMSKRLGVAH